MLLHFIGTQLAKYLTKEHLYEDHYFRISIDDIKSALEPGDVVLVEGQSRVSSAIQFITSSNWSHAAIFIGEAGSLSHCLIEVKEVFGSKPLANEILSFLNNNSHRSIVHPGSNDS